MIKLIKNLIRIVVFILISIVTLYVVTVFFVTIGFVVEFGAFECSIDPNFCLGTIGYTVPIGVIVSVGLIIYLWIRFFPKFLSQQTNRSDLEEGT